MHSRSSPGCSSRSGQGFSTISSAPVALVILLVRAAVAVKGTTDEAVVAIRAVEKKVREEGGELLAEAALSTDLGRWDSAAPRGSWETMLLENGGGAKEREEVC